MTDETSFGPGNCDEAPDHRGRDRRRTCFTDVGDFHAKMGLPVAGDRREPRLLTNTEFRFRSNFLFEELREFIEGHVDGDVAKCADALVDLVYVACGTAHYMGVPFDEVWSEVQRANMEKRRWREGDPVKPRAAAALDVVKPDGWREPDVRGIIARSREKAKGERK